MRRQREDKEDDPFTAQSYQHAQSELACVAGKMATNPLSVIIYLVLIVFYCSRKINHLVSEPFAFIL
jgi:hypothetical protein